MKMYSDSVVPRLTSALLRSSNERTSARGSGVIPVGGAHSASGLSGVSSAGNAWINSSSSATSANTSQNMSSLGSIGSLVSTIFG